MSRSRNLTVVLSTIVVAGLFLACVALAQHEAGPAPQPVGQPNPRGMGGPGGGGPGGGPAMRAPGQGPMAVPQPGPEQVQQFIGMVAHMARLCADSQAIGVMAVGSLKDDGHRKPAEIIKDLEGLLTDTKSLAIRNAIRLTLKDVYAAQGESDKVIEQLKALVLENDKALAAEKK